MWLQVIFSDGDSRNQSNVSYMRTFLRENKNPLWTNEQVNFKAGKVSVFSSFGLILLMVCLLWLINVLGLEPPKFKIQAKNKICMYVFSLFNKLA